MSQLMHTSSHIFKAHSCLTGVSIKADPHCWRSAFGCESDSSAARSALGSAAASAVQTAGPYMIEQDQQASRYSIQPPGGDLEVPNMQLQHSGMCPSAAPLVLLLMIYTISGHENRHGSQSEGPSPACKD